MACISARFHFLSVRRAAAVSVAALALNSLLYALAGHGDGERAAAAGILAVALLALTPRLWRGTRTAVGLTVLGLLALAALSATGGRVWLTAVQAALAVTLILARRAFRMGCCNRPRAGIAFAALAAWMLAIAAGPTIHLAVGTARLSANWHSLIEVLVGGAVITSVLALRSLVSPARADHHPAEHEYRAARAIVDAHGRDSLSPFVVRPDKALAFAAGGVLSYRVIGGTAIVSSDPVAPADRAGEVLAGFQDQARRNGWQIAVWGASTRHLDEYRRLGLRTLCVGEEAFVDPARFSLEGRAVRKLRQSVHRVERRGWRIEAHDGRAIGHGLETEIETLAARWRKDHPRVHGFAMGMGEYAGELRPDDLWVMARSPDGQLGAVMRFVVYGDNLSLDTMQRVGATPNGLNEALVVHALEVARLRGVAEVSLNYAGLAHLVRREPSHNRARRAITRLAMAPLHRRFQMDRLVRFNDKFSPQWRPRYLVYESRSALPRAIVRVLQAEGYLSRGTPSVLLAPQPRLLARAQPAGTRHRRALSEPR